MTEAHAPRESRPGEATRRVASGWARVVLLVLLVEKAIQHVAVTIAFAFDIDAIRASVAVPWGALAVVGATLAVLYAIAFVRTRRRRPGALALIVALALADVVGEFIAQGTIAITINVSFVVALVLLALVAARRRRERRCA